MPQTFYKLLATLSAILLISGFASAQALDIQPEPGFISADSPVYGIDIAVDNALVNIGAVNPADVAFERASEAVTANNSENRNRALEELRQNVQRVEGNSSLRGLARAEQVLERNLEKTPDQADKGLENALSNIRDNQKRVKDRIKERGGNLPEFVEQKKD